MPASMPTRSSPAWPYASTASCCARLGLPVIDIRAAQTAPRNERRAKAARLLVEGLRTLGLQLNATQRGSR